jgi:hypothetical protein
MIGISWKYRKLTVAVASHTGLLPKLVTVINKLAHIIEIRPECRCLQNISSFEIKMLAVFGAPLSVLTQIKENSFFDQIWCFLQ